MNYETTRQMTVIEPDAIVDTARLLHFLSKYLENYDSYVSLEREIDGMIDDIFYVQHHQFISEDINRNLNRENVRCIISEAIQHSLSLIPETKEQRKDVFLAETILYLIKYL
jgi:hypothetical protein